jgi:hypothetical protein
VVDDVDDVEVDDADDTIDLSDDDVQNSRKRVTPFRIEDTKSEELTNRFFFSTRLNR